jgi:uncharacterized membrane protein affecting hemolysin expression
MKYHQKLAEVQSKMQQRFNNTGNYLGIVLITGIFALLALQYFKTRKNHLKITDFNNLNKNDIGEHHRFLYRDDGALY